MNYGGHNDFYKRKFLLFDAKYNSSTSKSMVKNLTFGVCDQSDGIEIFKNEENLFNLLLVVVSAQSQSGDKRVEFCDLVSAVREEKLPDEKLFIEDKFEESLSTIMHDSFYKEDSGVENEALKNVIDFLHRKNNALNTEFEGLKSSYDILKTKNETYLKLNDLLKKEEIKKEEEIKLLNNRIDKLKTGVAELISQNDIAKNDNDQLKVDNDKLKSKNKLFFYRGGVLSLILLLNSLILCYQNGRGSCRERGVV